MRMTTLVSVNISSQVHVLPQIELPLAPFYSTPSISLSSLPFLLVYPSLVNESETASGDEDGRDGHGVGLPPGGRKRKTDKDDDLWTPQGKDTVCIYV